MYMEHVLISIPAVLCYPIFFQKHHLLKLQVPKYFMLVALDEGPGPTIKYQYADLSKLFALVSQLIRCCDISAKCSSSKVGHFSTQ